MLFITLSIGAQSPEDCEDGRYTTEVNYQFNVDSVTVQYARNVNAAGDTLDLMMTIFTPENDDLEERPVVILGFGGGFVSGNRQSLNSLCELLALRGIVAVTIDYRIYPISELGFPSLVEFYDTAVKAISDMKGAVRHIRKIADNGNPYGMDPDRIVVGGSSAGAITALHVGAISADDQIESPLDSLITANGGIEGNTGDSLNMIYSSDVLGVMNLSGGLLDTSYLDSDDNISINSMHGTQDEIVPFGYGNAVDVIPMYGSNLVHNRALNQNLNSRLTAVEGGGHSDIYSDLAYEDDRVDYFKKLDTTFLDIFCDASVATMEAMKVEKFQVFPNPVSSLLSWKKTLTGSDYRMTILNSKGERVLNKKVNSSIRSVNVSNLESGYYNVILIPIQQSDITFYQSKFIKQ